jgi:hypothetical protein
MGSLVFFYCPFALHQRSPGNCGKLPSNDMEGFLLPWIVRTNDGFQHNRFSAITTASVNAVVFHYCRSYRAALLVVCVPKRLNGLDHRIIPSTNCYWRFLCGIGHSISNSFFSWGNEEGNCPTVSTNGVSVCIRYDASTSHTARFCARLMKQTCS